MTNPPRTRHRATETLCPWCARQMTPSSSTYVRSSWSNGRTLRAGPGTMLHKRCAPLWYDQQQAGAQLQQLVEQHLRSGFLERLRVADRVHGLRYLQCIAADGDAAAMRAARRSYWRFVLPRWLSRFVP